MSAEPTSAHLDQATKLWSLTAPISFHRRVENFVYFTGTADGEAVLRITEPTRRAQGDIASELDWQIWLAKNGGRCAQPIPSVKGRLVEELLVEGASYYACLFEKAPGSPLREPRQFTKSVMSSWGQAVGRFHRLARDYRPSENIKPRRQWDEDFSHSIASVLREEPESAAGAELDRLLNWMSGLTKGRDDYGLVHTDLHHGNFFFDDDVLTAFDFDDCCYHWFAYDFAVPIFYLRFYNEDLKMGLDLPSLERDYLAGYREEFDLGEEWISRVEAFIRYRALIMYGWSKAQLRDKKLNEGVLDWCRNYCEWCLKELERPLALR